MKNLRACDMCGEKHPRRGYRVGWKPGVQGDLVLCTPCAEPLGPFLRLAVNRAKTEPIRLLTAKDIENSP